MKTFLSVAACALVFVSPAFSQKTIREQPDVYEVGSKHIRLPPPAGFTEVFRNADEKIVAQFRRGEDPGNEIIAGYLPDAAIRELKTSGKVDKTFLARISIRSKFKSVDITPEEFAGNVAYLEKHLPEYLDPNGPLVKPLLKKLEKEKEVSFGQARNLGIIEKNNRVFSMLLLFSAEIQGQTIAMIAAASYVHVHERLLYTSIFKVMPEYEDMETVRAMSKQWTAAIVSANKHTLSLLMDVEVVTADEPFNYRVPEKPTSGFGSGTGCGWQPWTQVRNIQIQPAEYGPRMDKLNLASDPEEGGGNPAILRFSGRISRVWPGSLGSNLRVGFIM